MPWIKVTLRGQWVFARADASGKLALAEDGRVEIRYKPNDGRVYNARAQNLEVAPNTAVLPDETCGPATTVPSLKDETTTAKKTAAGKNAKRAATKANGSGLPPPVEKGAFIAYADGACSGNPGPCGLGVVIVAPDGKIREGYEYLGEGTNNVAELTAVMRAVQGVPPDAPALVIHTDSQYSIGVLTKGWKAKANQALIVDVKKSLSDYGKARLVYVPGHAGVPLNERADQLAREAVQTRGIKPL